MKRRVVFALSMVLLLGVCALLYGPIATWLECHECWLLPDARVDAIYVMAGMRERDRVEGVVHWLQQGGQAERILLSRNPNKGRWSSRDQRNLSMGEWTLRFMREELAGAELNVPVEVVETDMGGTDPEVASVARLLSQRPDLETVALATSRFHLRRTRQRAARHFDPPPGMIPGMRTRHDRAPVVVMLELLKLLRDRLGLSRAPVVTRAWWSRMFGASWAAR